MVQIIRNGKYIYLSPSMNNFLLVQLLDCKNQHNTFNKYIIFFCLSSDNKLNITQIQGHWKHFYHSTYDQQNICHVLKNFK